MSEQPNRYRVTFYCDRCARFDGRKRILAVAERGRDPHWHPDPWDQWRLSVFRRAGRAPAEPGVAVATSRTGGIPHGKRKRVAMQVGRRIALVPLDPFDTAAQLICRHCKARPREGVAALVKLAEQTVAAGRRDAYI